MEIIILLIAISLTIAVFFLGAFIWNMKSGQYDDTYGPSVRMLFEDKKKSSSKDEVPLK
jgi:cbb3-type cytochrome oxidase maturation protein